METETNPTPMKLTAAQLALLARIADNPRSSSRDMNYRTLNALWSRELIEMADRFPSGTSLWSVTSKGRNALLASGGAR